MDPRFARLAVAHEVESLKREFVERSLEAFCRLYMPSRFTSPFAPMHRHIVKILEWIAEEPDFRLAVAMAPGHGKTALVAVGHALWRMCIHRLPHIVIVCADEATAVETITEFGFELGGNEALLRAFPFVAAKNRGGGNEIVTRGGQRIAAVAAGERLLGRRRVGPAPGLLICDDVEQWRTMDTWGGGQRRGIRAAELRDWLERAMASRLAPGADAVVVGSIAADDAYLADLVDPDVEPGWHKMAFPALRFEPERDRALWDRFDAIASGWQDTTGYGHGEEGARKFFEAHREKLSAGVKPAWPERFTACDLRLLEFEVNRSRRRDNVFECVYRCDPRREEPPGRARAGPAARPGALPEPGGAPGPAPWTDENGVEWTPCGDEYDRNVFFTDPEGLVNGRERGFLTYAPDHTPNLKGGRAPPFLFLVHDVVTGAKRVTDTFRGRRRIVGAWTVDAYWAHVKRLAAKAGAAGDV